MLVLHNLLRLKSREDSYTLKGSDDEIQSHRSLLQGERHENPSSSKTTDLERGVTRKQNLYAEKLDHYC